MNSRLQGVGLIELLVVLAISSLLVGLAPVAYNQARESSQYRTTLRTMTADMRQARQLAAGAALRRPLGRDDAGALPVSLQGPFGLQHLLFQVGHAFLQPVGGLARHLVAGVEVVLDEHLRQRVGHARRQRRVARLETHLRDLAGAQQFHFHAGLKRPHHRLGQALGRPVCHGRGRHHAQCRLHLVSPC